MLLAGKLVKARKARKLLGCQTCVGVPEQMSSKNVLHRCNLYFASVCSRIAPGSTPTVRESSSSLELGLRVSL